MTQPKQECWVFLRNQKQWEDTHVAEGFSTKVVLLPWQHCLELFKAGIDAVQKILNFLSKKTKLHSTVRHKQQEGLLLPHRPGCLQSRIVKLMKPHSCITFHSSSLRYRYKQELWRLPEQQAQLQLPGQKAVPPSIPTSSPISVSGECSQIPAWTPVFV